MFQRIVAMLAIGVLPALALGQQDQSPSARSPIHPPKSLLLDVSLLDDGSLVGVYVDKQGAPMKDGEVILRQRGVTVASATTNQDGQFRVRVARGGVYEIATMRGSQTVRLWTHDLAPPAARPSIVLVDSQTVVRGQGCDNCQGAGCRSCCPPTRGQSLLFNPNSMGYQLIQTSALAGTTASTIVSLSQTNSLQNQINQLQNASP